MKDRIKQIRKAAGMTQKEFADKLEVNRLLISQWETGAAKPGKMRLYQIANLFNVNLEWLQNGTGEIYKQPPETIKAAEVDPEMVKKLFSALPPEYKKAILEAVKDMIETGADFPRFNTNIVDISGTVNGNVDINQSDENKE